jgi:cob(I)alamin adenosyltransferase
VQAFRTFLKRSLPRPLVQWIRRQRAARRYLKALSYEMVERDTRLDDIDARVAIHSDGFYQQMVREILERSDVMLHELNRRIEGQGARHDERLQVLEEQIGELRRAVDRLQEALHPAESHAIRPAE